MAAFAAVVALQRCNQKHGNQNIAVTHAYIPQIMDQTSTQFAIES
jgi:hypothetical protein